MIDFGCIRQEGKNLWSGRKDSNLGPPGPEPGFRRFAVVCTGLLIFHIFPLQPVSSMGYAPTALHPYALSCGLWLHEKGKKRARFRGVEIASDHRKRRGLLAARRNHELQPPAKRSIA